MTCIRWHVIQLSNETKNVCDVTYIRYFCDDLFFTIKVPFKTKSVDLA